MLEQLRQDPLQVLEWTWKDYEPYAAELSAAALSEANIQAWLLDTSRFAEAANDQFNRLYVATTVNTADETAKKRFEQFIDETQPKVLEAQQAWKEKLLASGLQPAGFEIPLRNFKAEADLFRAENLPLLGEEQKLSNEYDRIMGAQTVTWDGKEQTLSALKPVFQSTDRALREKAWRAVAERQLADRAAINDLWGRMLDLRLKIAANAGKEDYRAYKWQSYLRFDYTPADCHNFHKAIEQVVVPAATRIYERRRKALGLDSVRPWDVDVNPHGLPPLRPYQTLDELTAGVSRIFHRVDPQLGEYFDIMRRENLLDLDNRKNKAPGGYCIDFPINRRPFIFTNAVGLHDDVNTLLHEGGHSFHVFETAGIQLTQLLNIGMEIAEVASMSMEMIAMPYLEKQEGGFYNHAEARRAQVEKLEECILFWPYMAIVDAFQHWVYENPVKAADPANCDAAWSELWDRFIPGVDWSGLEAEKATGWHRKPHIFEVPFYYVEYGLAQLGAAQLWRNSLRDPAGAVAAYRRALALGGSKSLPELYQAAGVRLAFDAETLGQAVSLMEEKILAD